MFFDASAFLLIVEAIKTSSVTKNSLGLGYILGNIHTPDNIKST